VLRVTRRRTEKIIRAFSKGWRGSPKTAPIYNRYTLPETPRVPPAGESPAQFARNALRTVRARPKRRLRRPIQNRQAYLGKSLQRPLSEPPGASWENLLTDRAQRCMSPRDNRTRSWPNECPTRRRTAESVTRFQPLPAQGPAWSVRCHASVTAAVTLVILVVQPIGPFGARVLIIEPAEHECHPRPFAPSGLVRLWGCDQ